MRSSRPQITQLLPTIIESAVKDNEDWFPKVAANPFFMTACLAGEVGEVLNLLKKVERGTHPWNDEMREQVIEELADAFTYLVSVAGILKADLAEAYWAKRQINATRFSARQALEAPDDETFRREREGQWTQNVPYPQDVVQRMKDAPTIQMMLPINADGYPE